MTTGTMNLGDLKNLSAVLARTPNGAEVSALAERLGLLTAGSLGRVRERRRFIVNVSELDAAALSNEQAYWAGEFGRIVELVGLLQGQEKYLALRAKQVRSQARGRVRRLNENVEVEEGGDETTATKKSGAKVVKMTATQVNDLAENDPAVMDVENQSSLVVVLAASALAAKEATAMYLSTLSREISFRCSQMDNKLWGSH